MSQRQVPVKQTPRTTAVKAKAGSGKPGAPTDTPGQEPQLAMQRQRHLQIYDGPYWTKICTKSFPLVWDRVSLEIINVHQCASMRTTLHHVLAPAPAPALMPTGAATSRRCFLVFRALIGTASTGAGTTDAPFHTLVLPQQPGGCTGTVALAPSMMALCPGSAQAGSP
ncbi:hypothetical protein OE88DRAFT_1729694 [Heliocybe sulcata]|uniref:Uncharacterized protein n=1 Tax=Heliocybe sulcata TaxID=5364 RepID=A0A5C3MN36_9AGAM|nr:hypothetical protein OE88DRAFT_1729694 [Heliocybe sulcata]